MVATWTPHNLALKKFVQDNYDAKHCRVIPGGSHPRFEWYVNGKRYEIITHVHRDSRNIANDITNIIAMVGAVKPKEDKPKQSLAVLTEQAEANANKKLPMANEVAKKALAPFREFAEANATTTPPDSIPIEIAEDIKLVKEDTSYTLLFRASRKVYAGNKIVPVLKTVAAVSVEVPSIMAFYEQARQIVDAVREAEAEIARQAEEVRLEEERRLAAETARQEEEARRLEAANKKKKVWNPDQIPIGSEAILQAAQIVLEGRELAQATANGRREGGVYNRALGEWYKGHGMGDLAPHIRHELNMIADNYPAIAEWAKDQPAAKFTGRKPNKFITSWQDWQKRHPQEPTFLTSPRPNGRDHHPES